MSWLRFTNKRCGWRRFVCTNKQKKLRAKPIRLGREILPGDDSAYNRDVVDEIRRYDDRNDISEDYEKREHEGIEGLRSRRANIEREFSREDFGGYDPLDFPMVDDEGELVYDNTELDADDFDDADY